MSPLKVFQICKQDAQIREKQLTGDELGIKKSSSSKDEESSLKLNKNCSL